MRTKEPSGERRKSEVSFRSDRSGGGTREVNRGEDELEGEGGGDGEGKPPPITRVRSSSAGVGG